MIELSYRIGWERLKLAFSSDCAEGESAEPHHPCALQHFLNRTPIRKIGRWEDRAWVILFRVVSLSCFLFSAWLTVVVGRWTGIWADIWSSLAG